jgi:transcriptional regulator with XRE-family HTH domain
MSIQRSSISGIPPGFGQRLKEERKRLNMSQADFAEIAGCQRLAQLQYESEATAPTTRYLSAIGAAGVDLSYLILGLRFGQGILTPEQALNVEDKTFEWIEQCAQRLPDGKLGTETYKMLFKLFRGLLTQVELGQLPADFDPTLLISSEVRASGKS